MKYHIWTAGCQMNVVDSQRVASALENLGYQNTTMAEDADVIVLNTCVVRQSAEDKAYGRLNSLKSIKYDRPEVIINLMGCLVGVKGNAKLHKKFPHVDVFSPPSDPGPLIAHLTGEDSRAIDRKETAQRFAYMDGESLIPAYERGVIVSAHVPVVYGCSHACTFCIIPYRRGVERSRPVDEIVSDVRVLTEQGIKEVTLLGQIVDRYGIDIPNGPQLADLLHIISEVEGLERVRFLTSHPNWMKAELLDTVARLPKVMPHIEVPVQAGDDVVLESMRRGYTADNYRKLVARIRERIPGVSIATDVIVGFPGETHAQFQSTYDLLDELKLDVAHLARYSTRPGTVAARQMADAVPDEEKWKRFRLLEDLQKRIATDINSTYLDKTVPVLFEEKIKDRWKGRTPTNKLVFVQSEHDLRAEIIPVRITWTGPWSMQARFSEENSESLHLSLTSTLN